MQIRKQKYNSHQSKLKYKKTVPYFLIHASHKGCRHNCNLDNFTPWYLYALSQSLGAPTQQANKAELSRAP